MRPRILWSTKQRAGQEFVTPIVQRSSNEHWHYINGKGLKPVTHKHLGGNDWHTHFDKGLIGHGQVRQELKLRS